MNGKHIKIIITLSTVFLGILLFLQYFWIRQSIQLTQTQIDHRTNLAIKDILNELNTKLVIEGKDTTTMSYAQQLIMEIKVERRNALKDSIQEIIFQFLTLYDLDSTSEYEILNPASELVYTSTMSTDNEEEYFLDMLSPKTLTGVMHINQFRGQKLQLSMQVPRNKFEMAKKLWYWFLATVIVILFIVVGWLMVIWTYMRQRKLSEMKTSFVNNLTHELQTPISTITLASDMLIKLEMQNQTDKVKRYSGIISSEIKRLRHLVERALKQASYEKGNITLNKAETDLHTLIEDTILHIQQEFPAPDTLISTHFLSTHPKINVDEAHLSTAIGNLIDNSIKYSDIPRKIKVSSFDTSDSVCITIEDNGKGINSSDLKFVFEKFSRFNTSDVHNIKGYGLGLHYVKLIVEAHGGKIKLKSEPNKGTRIEIFLTSKK